MSHLRPCHLILCSTFIFPLFFRNLFPLSISLSLSLSLFLPCVLFLFFAWKERENLNMEERRHRIAREPFSSPFSPFYFSSVSSSLSSLLLDRWRCERMACPFVLSQLASEAEGEGRDALDPNLARSASDFIASFLSSPRAFYLFSLIFSLISSFFIFSHLILPRSHILSFPSLHLLIPSFIFLLLSPSLF